MIFFNNIIFKNIKAIIISQQFFKIKTHFLLYFLYRFNNVSKLIRNKRI